MIYYIEGFGKYFFKKSLHSRTIFKQSAGRSKPSRPLNCPRTTFLLGIDTRTLPPIFFWIDIFATKHLHKVRTPRPKP